MSTYPTINAEELKIFYDSFVTNYINSNYPMQNGYYTPLFSDAPAGAWTNFFEVQFVTSIRGIRDGSQDAAGQASQIRSGSIINARLIQDAFIGHAASEMTRYRLIGSTRTLTGTTNNAAAHPRPTTSERRTGRGGRLRASWRAPGFSNPYSSSFVSSGRTIEDSEAITYMNAIRDEWIRVAGNTTAGFELNFTVCHSSCHNQCHGSRGRR
jgi:hypothetical protein